MHFFVALGRVDPNLSQQTRVLGLGSTFFYCTQVEWPLASLVPEESTVRP